MNINSIVLCYINGVWGEFVLLIYWPSFRIAQSYEPFADNLPKCLRCACLHSGKFQYSSHTWPWSRWTFKSVTVSVTCRFITRSVTAASRCIPGRHGWSRSRSRCAGPRDSDTWNTPGCFSVNRTGCTGADTTADCYVLFLLYWGKGKCSEMSNTVTDRGAKLEETRKGKKNKKKLPAQICPHWRMRTEKVRHTGGQGHWQRCKRSVSSANYMRTFFFLNVKIWHFGSNLLCRCSDCVFVGKELLWKHLGWQQQRSVAANVRNCICQKIKNKIKESLNH